MENGWEGDWNGRTCNSPNSCLSARCACSRRLTFRARGWPEKSEPIIAVSLPGRDLSLCEASFGGLGGLGRTSCSPGVVVDGEESVCEGVDGSVGD